MPTLVKICGLSSPGTLLATIAAGADMAGFVFFEKSPRHVDLETARTLGLMDGLLLRDASFARSSG